MSTRPTDPVSVINSLKRELMSARTKLQRDMAEYRIGLLYSTGKKLTPEMKDAARVQSTKEEAELFKGFVSKYTSAMGSSPKDVVLSTPAVLKSLIQDCKNEARKYNDEDEYEHEHEHEGAVSPVRGGADIASVQEDPRYISAKGRSGDAVVSFQRKRGLELFKTSPQGENLPSFGRGSLFPTLSPQAEQEDMEMPVVEDGMIEMPQVSRVTAPTPSDDTEPRIRALEAKVDRLTQLVGALMAANRGARK